MTTILIITFISGLLLGGVGGILLGSILASRRGQETLEGSPISTAVKGDEFAALAVGEVLGQAESPSSADEIP